MPGKATDIINDLFQFHINNYSPAKAAAVRDMLEELVSEGKMRFTQATENAEAMQFGPLSDEQLREIEQLLAR